MEILYLGGFKLNKSLETLIERYIDAGDSKNLLHNKVVKPNCKTWANFEGFMSNWPGSWANRRPPFNYLVFLAISDVGDAFRSDWISLSVYFLHLGSCITNSSFLLDMHGFLRLLFLILGGYCHMHK